jgi:hypothetical protein
VTQVVLAPCADKGSVEHFQETVLSPVPLSQMARFLSEGHLAHLAVAHADGTAACWGVMPGTREKQVTKWARIEPGDQVVLARHGRLFSRATVTDTFRAPDLARALWGEAETLAGVQTWELMFTLDDITDIDVPYGAMNAAIGWRPSALVQEFNVLQADPQSAALLPLLGRQLRLQRLMPRPNRSLPWLVMRSNCRTRSPRSSSFQVNKTM